MRYSIFRLTGSKRLFPRPPQEVKGTVDGMGKQIIRLPVTQEMPGAAPGTVEWGKSRSWSIAPDCKSGSSGYGGSNPPFPRAKDFSILSAGFVFIFREVAESVMQSVWYQADFKRNHGGSSPPFPAIPQPSVCFPSFFQTAGTSGFWQVGREADASCLLNNRRRRFSRRFKSCTCR